MMVYTHWLQIRLHHLEKSINPFQVVFAKIITCTAGASQCFILSIISNAISLGHFPFAWNQNSLHSDWLDERNLLFTNDGLWTDTSGF